VTKQLGKTLTSIGESPDKRGLKRMFRAQNPQTQSTVPDDNLVQNDVNTDDGT
jgi:hypothetical protein